jgi:hypothetical protein
MRKLFSTIGVVLTLVPSLAFSAPSPVTRRDGFLEIWSSIRRSTEKTSEKAFTDVPSGARGYAEITYAKYRGLIDDEDGTFRPDDPLLLRDALLWLFRARSVDDVKNVIAAKLPDLLARYPVAEGDPSTFDRFVTDDDLLSLMRRLDQMLADEEHEVSLYGEEFQGENTAFGESFDLNALTAAHRTFPYNTLVKVTNLDNGKSVTVRINDRGPYVEGRDLDLSVAAFETIADRAQGVLRHVTFQRLGDAKLVGPCSQEPRYQSRIVKNVRLLPGIPNVFRLTDATGATLVVRGSQPFVVRQVTYPDGNVNNLQDWVLSGDAFRFAPSVEGEYVFVVGTKLGRQREMTMRVVRCST